ncbi:aspartate kinase, partial [Candidatus Synechococcus spongiarum]|uniref:aspartate kinase n=1 Tax=Candidatus Synechococcus spongiarum TaxID=431041 RepID=UPI000470B01B
MALLVQKFGGSSVGSLERLKAVAQRVCNTRRGGDDVVAVVSAMGKTTDELTRLAHSISRHPPQRELDMLLASGEQVSIALLSMALQELGLAAVSMTGQQVGIVTEAAHGRARILNIRTERVRACLAEGAVVVAAGFQGAANGGLEITTLGRGGSDTSAVALAAALGAERCEIYTDVEGVLTTDPRIVPGARLLESITCDEMLELASLGAAVLHPRAVEIARNYGLPLVVRSSWSEHPGTCLTSNRRQRVAGMALELGKPVDALELVRHQGLIALSHVPDRPGVAAQLSEALSEAGINVDLIVQSLHEGASNDMAFTLERRDLERAQAVVSALSGHLGGPQPFVVAAYPELAKLSLVGAGITGRPDVVASMFATLGQAGISLRMIATSEVKVSCVIEDSDAAQALDLLRGQFALTPSQVHLEAIPCEDNTPAVRGVALDWGQAQASVHGVPDWPGAAAAICRALSDDNISLDTIVQSECTRQTPLGAARDLAFTLPRQDLDQARQALAPLLQQWPGAELIPGGPIARVSAVGAGMPCTAGTAGRMFRALADAGINIAMIATSEIR